jgi:DNA-binding transcriptional LysR family regulator
MDYFIATAESGQVSHAAINLNISQSAVTAAIKSLEIELGVKLFERTHSGVRLTMEGSRFLERARAINGAVAAAVRSPLRDRTEFSGKVRIGMTYTVIGYFMSKYYSRFLKTYPQISVEIEELSRPLLEKKLARGDVDIALMLISNLENRDELDHELLLRSSRRLWLAADHPLLSRSEISLSDVAKEDYVMLTVDEASNTAGRYWETTGLAPQVVLTTSSVEAVRSLVAAGVGVTILSDMVYRPWSLDGQRIELRRLVESIPSMDVGLAWARKSTIPPAATTFRSFMSVTMGGGG